MESTWIHHCLLLTLCKLYRSYHAAARITQTLVSETPSPSAPAPKRQATTTTTHQNSATTSKVDPSTPTDVIYVEDRNAKQFKTLLEETRALDKRYRMTKQDDGRIALSVNHGREQQLDGESISMVLGKGQIIMPLSTSQFARKTMQPFH
jgi:hypothetical protein